MTRGEPGRPGPSDGRSEQPDEALIQALDAMGPDIELVERDGRAILVIDGVEEVLPEVEPTSR